MPLTVVAGVVTEIPEAAIWRGPPDRERILRITSWLYPLSGRWIMRRVDAAGTLRKWQFCGEYR